MKKTLAIILALIMVVCLLPTIAFADGAAIYVSSSGDDNNDGTETKPYATLAKAVYAAPSGATIYVMSDLTMSKCARYYNKNLTITSLGENAFKVTRGDGFFQQQDDARSTYNPAMIEAQANIAGGEYGLTLENIILDDGGKKEGTVFAQAISGEGKENNAIYVQDAMIASNATVPCTITLGEGAILRNFGGMSAVRVTDQAKLVMESGSKIEDTMVTDRVKGDSGSVGPAGAIWVQNASVEMKADSEISNVIGRAVYADGGEATIGGTISGITGNSNMWQGTNGSAIHLRNSAKGTLTGTCAIENVSGGESAVYTTGCDLTVDNGCVIKNVVNTKGIQVEGKCIVFFDGEITGMSGKSNALNLQNAEFQVTIGKNANIHDNHTGYGTIYIQAQNGKLDIYGKINNNIASDRGGAIAMANNFKYPTLVTMYDGAEICNNYSAQTGGGVMVSVGIFTMKGGTISGNSAKEEGGGIYVRRGGSLIMEGGAIINNATAKFGGGIAYEAGNYNGGVPSVTLNGGTISGNMMGATIETNTTNGMIAVSEGESNDLAVSNKDDVFSKADRYLYISDKANVGNKAVYFQTDNKTITPADDSFNIKFGNASGDSIDALKTASNDKGWSAPLATFWTQRDNAATMTVGGLTINPNNPVVYALMYKTDEAGSHTGELVVCTTTVEGNNVTLTVPGSKNGFAVALVQPTKDFGNVVITGPAEITKDLAAETYGIPYKATYTMSQNFIEQLKTLPEIPAGDNSTGIELKFVVQLDNRLTAKKDAAGKFIYTFDGAGVLEPIESGIAVSADDHTITVPCTLKNGWQEAIIKADEIVMTLYGTGVLQAGDFNPGGVLGTTGNIQAILPIQGEIINVLIPANVCQTNMVGSDPTPSPSTDPSTSPTPTPGGGNGGGYYHPTTTPVPVIVIPPKTGDMTVWQSILHFLGIR